MQTISLDLPCPCRQFCVSTTIHESHTNTIANKRFLSFPWQDECEICIIEIHNGLKKQSPIHWNWGIIGVSLNSSWIQAYLCIFIGAYEIHFYTEDVSDYPWVWSSIAKKARSYSKKWHNVFRQTRPRPLRYMENKTFSGLSLFPNMFMPFYRCKQDTCVQGGALTPSLNLLSLNNKRGLQTIYRNAKRTPGSWYAQRKQPECNISLDKTRIRKLLCISIALLK